MEQQSRSKQHIALFIDADNAPANKIDVILSELANYGLVTIRKAYGNWTKPNLKPWSECLHEHAIQPIQQFDITKQKNAADIALVIDCMDTLHAKSVDVICIVSSDCDFTPLATRCAAEGKFVIGFGERTTPKPFVDGCSKFLYLDQIRQGEDVCDKTPGDAPKGINKELNGETGLINLLRAAISNTDVDDGWAPLSSVGAFIANRASFDQRNYGYKKLSDLFAAIDLFELEVRENGITWVRDKRYPARSAA